MRTGKKSGRVHRPRSLYAAGALTIALLLAGCGNSGSGPAATSGVGSNATSTSTAGVGSKGAMSTSTAGSAPAPHRSKPSRVRTSTEQASNPAAAGLAFSKCMRANGVTNFPDPTSGRGLGFNVSSAVTSSPAFRTAQAKCQKLLPQVVGPGGGSPPSRQTMARLLRIATCMRAHGIHQFPDPLYSRPAVALTPGKYQEITNFDGATLLFPQTMNLQAPAYRHALTACGAPPLGLPH